MNDQSSNQHHREDSVGPEQVCPWCGESCIDRLIWIEDDVVECHTCTCRYDPSMGLVWRDGRAELGPRSDA